MKAAIGIIAVAALYNHIFGWFSAPDIFNFIKIGVYLSIVFVVLITPEYLAIKNGKVPYEVRNISIASWIFGWAVIPYIWALYMALKKDKD